MLDIISGKRLSGVVADGDVSVVAFEAHGETSATLTYRTAAGALGERIVTDKMETDRRAVEAVMAVERKLGRNPERQHHSNPGFDVLSVDPETGVHYFIEVKGHLPQTTEIGVSAQQVQKAKSNPDRWRLAIASVPNEPGTDPAVRYLVEPFRDVTLHFAQTKVVLNVAALLAAAGAPC